MRLTAVAGLLLACAPADGTGDLCGPWEGVHGTVPSDGATGVPVNVQPLVRFAPGRGNNAELALVTADGSAVFGNGARLQGAWVFVPSAPLSPDTEYLFLFEAQDVAPVTVRFATGAGEDLEPPYAREPSTMSWEWLPPGAEGDPCGWGDYPDSSFRVELEIPPVGGEADAQQVEQQVFMTESRMTGPPVEIAHAYPGADGVTVASVTLPVETGEGETCFVVVARDAAGNYSGATSEACVEMEPGPFFESCSVGSGGARRPCAAVLVVAVALALRSRRRRRPRRPGRTATT